MNILSVDFDIIMAPDINLYNNLVNNEKTIDDLIKEHILLNGIKVDLEHYKKLTLYLFNLIETLSENDIRISYNHEDIKFLLDGLENVKIFNIDHHHDLGYSEKPIGDCGCANWGEYYLNKGIISNFTWIKNVNSIEKMNLKEQPWNDLIKHYNLIDIVSLDDFLPKIDKLFICLSPEWVPKYYHPLFYLIIDYFNKYYETHFTIY